MCGVRNEEVFSMISEGQKPVVLLSATERLRQVIVAQNLQVHGPDRVTSLKLAEEFYKGCLEVGEWPDVVALANKYLDIAGRENNDYLRYLIRSLLDVLEEAGQSSGDGERAEMQERIAKAFLVKLDFTSSKGLTLKEVYERAGSKEQFAVILKFLWDHPRCSGELKEAVAILMTNFNVEEERKCA